MKRNDNPFATRFIKPGAIPFVFNEERSIESLCRRFEELGGAVSIIGPHGSGKTTLVRQLADSLTDRLRINWIGLEPSNHFVVSKKQWSDIGDPETLTVIDGYDQLSAWTRWRIKRRAIRSNGRLIVTAHAPTNLPCLIELQPSCELFLQLVQSLLRRRDLVSNQDAIDAFQKSHGNIREAFMILYDVALRSRDPETIAMRL